MARLLPRSNRGLWLGLGLIARVAGDSMLPTLAPGDIVFARRARRVPPGQVALMRLGQRWLVKRVVRYDEDGGRCLLGVEAPFGWVPRSAIQARVVGVYRIGKGFARL
ncbi:MAG TPA: S24 family peptidase [Herpetosiphonaceae bacterium]|nr:S24 family peptidase [Herpetosiphonaceae bacterium]